MAKRWGVGSEFDPDWVLDDVQKELRDKLRTVCQNKIKSIAIESDKTYEYPREALDELAELGLLSLIVPKELGGLGQNHVCAVMIVETLARYGCPSTAMIYSMHLQATAILLFRHHNNDEIQSLIKNLTKDKLIGTSSYSDAATGGHFWFPLSAKSQQIDEETFKLFRFNSWTTSAGFADFYVFQTPTPGIKRDHSNLTGFYALKNEVRASTDDWNSLGLHGNQAGPLIVEGNFSRKRIIGNLGDGRKSNDEVGANYFLICTSACWNGIAMACVDVAKKHVCAKTHGDLGTRVCDYPIIQDYVGNAIVSTNGCRGFLYMIAHQLDSITKDNDWSLHKDPDFVPRSAYVLWLMQVKHNCSENVSRVSEKMLKACGGDGYKVQTGIERLLRDSKAGCLMAPTNEVIRRLVGVGSLKGLEAMDMWDQTSNFQVVNHEIQKMSIDDKKSLLQRLSEDIRLEEDSKPINHPNQDVDFDNPFNTSSPQNYETYMDKSNVSHTAALTPDSWTKLKLISRTDFHPSSSSFSFQLPSPTDHFGCLTGQYIKIRVESEGQFHDRYISPVSTPSSYGSIEIILKFETHGTFSHLFRNMKIGDSAEFRGPCGGFEYHENVLDELTILASGSGLTPGLQLIRSVASNKEDETRITLLYYADDYDSILYEEELNNLNSCDKRMRFITSLGNCPSKWNGEEGFIDIEKINQYVTKPNEKKHKIIVCGGPSMSIACLHALRLLNFHSDQIFIYGPFGTEQIRSVYGKNAKLSSHCV